MEDVSKEEFRLWKRDKVTKEVWKVLNERIQNRAENLAAGGALGDDVSQQYAFNVGYIRACTDLFNIEYEEQDNDRTFGTEGPGTARHY